MTSQRGSQGRARQEDLRLTSTDDGGERHADVGQRVLIDLQETPTSGYRWWLTITPPGAGEVVDSSWKPHERGVLGGSGTREFCVVLKQPGRVRMDLKLYRQWQGEASAAAVHHFVIEVGQQQEDGTEQEQR